MEEHIPQDPEATAITRDHRTVTTLAAMEREALPPLPETIAAIMDHPSAKPSSTKGPIRINGPPSCRRSNRN